MLPPELDLVVHATHEAGARVGGIGAVLDGILAEPTYNRVVRRTILVGTFDPSDPVERERLRASRNGFSVLYSTLDEISQIDAALARAFERIELYYHVNILYGTRRFGDAQHEILLIDPRDVVSSVVARFKYHLWERYSIQSEHYESSPEYERTVYAAEPSFTALQALVGEGGIGKPPHLRAPRMGRKVLIAHDWMGVPLALCASGRLEPEPPDRRYRTVFYAHEVTTARHLVEDHPGHDTRFYNVLKAAHRQGLSLEGVFGDQRSLFEHALVTAAVQFDGVLAVSDVTMEELHFLSRGFAARPIALVYNGIRDVHLSLADRQASRARMRDYIQSLLGYRPDWVFTHVSRLGPSEGLWRDVGILSRLDAEWARRGEKGVLLTLACSNPAGRPAENVRRWEREYCWPVAHHTDNGELAGAEIGYYRFIEDYNKRARASRVILINQFGWGSDRCGERMPAEMRPDDVYHGSDLEFGLSIYEPFGIGQVEPLPAGVLCCMSTACGCLGLVRQLGRSKLPNILAADYVTLPHGLQTVDIAQLLAIGQQERDMVEASEAARVASRIIERLPRSNDAVDRLLQDGYDLSRGMSWKVIAEEGFLPALVGLF